MGFCAFRGPAVVVETKLPTVDGWYTVAGYPLYNDQHKQWGAVLVVRDIMKRKLVEEDFPDALAAALKLAHSEDADYLPGWCGPVSGD